jgi:glycosyltransferase involved in cell wall biosynthesis
LKTINLMSISVLIPAYNCSKTIQATLESVLHQTVAPDQVLVMDDGSTDNTPTILETYGSRITVLRQPNKGAAAARNALVERAVGDLVAFLDSDDIWHPRYLEVQRKLFEEHPNAVAFFTGHVSFSGYGDFDWDKTSVDSQVHAELIDPLNFVKRYNATGIFASMSICCVPKEALMRMGSEHFCVNAAEDAYFCNVLPLLGRPVAHVTLPLVAYRLIGTSLSANQLKVYSALVEVFRILQDRYDRLGAADLLTAFRSAFASKRRTYAKLLMAAGRTAEARNQFRLSLRDSGAAVSRAKSLALLLLSYMPSRFQPSWPATTRPLPT